MRRSVVIAAVVSLVLSVVVSTGAPAAAGGKCKKAKPAVPQSVSSSAAEAPKQKVIAVTEKATADNPITVEYEHGPAVADQSLGELVTGDPKGLMLLEDARFFNFQLTGKARASIVNMAIDWGTPSMSDIDLRLYSGLGGSEIDYSAAFNPMHNPAVNTVWGGDDDNGLEQLLGVVMSRCESFTIESRPAWSTGEDAVALKVWLE